MKRVLLTGASGDVGTRLRKLLKPIYPDLVLSDVKTPANLADDETFVPADLAKFDEVAKIVNVPVNTVKTRMFHARRRLARQLEDAGLEREFL